VALVESLRTGANRLQADLTLLEGNMGELYGASGRAAFTPPDAVADRAPEREVEAPAAPADVPPPALSTFEELAAAAEAAPAPAPVEVVATGTNEDVEGARLVALNMALNGTARDETERYLAENFDLPDRQGLLDEVYASVEG
jgi:hypothetical protein